MLCGHDFLLITWFFVVPRDTGVLEPIDLHTAGLYHSGHNALHTPYTEDKRRCVKLSIPNFTSFTGARYG